MPRQGERSFLRLACIVVKDRRPPAIDSSPASPSQAHHPSIHPSIIPRRRHTHTSCFLLPSCAGARRSLRCQEQGSRPFCSMPLPQPPLLVKDLPTRRIGTDISDLPTSLDFLWSREERREGEREKERSFARLGWIASNVSQRARTSPPIARTPRPWCPLTPKADGDCAGII